MENTKKTLTKGVATIAFVVIILYVFLQFRGLIEGPEIKINEPGNGALIKSEQLEILGKTKNVSQMTTNGKETLIQETGDFEESLLLARGYNIIEFVAIDRFGRERREILEIIYKQNGDKKNN